MLIVEISFDLEVIVILNSIISNRIMHKELVRRTHKFNHLETQPISEEGDQKLHDIIRTFRENHMRLIQKIEECDKKRDFEHELSRKKMS